MGLVLNSRFGWAWADPIAGLKIVALAVKEGIDAGKGQTCCPAPVTAVSGTPRRGCDCCAGWR